MKGKKLLVLLLLVAMTLTGCSAASLQKAERNTRLAGMVPGGDLIWFPIFVASTIVGPPKISEEGLKKIRAKSPNCIEWPGQTIHDQHDNVFTVDYACPADPNWDEIQAQIKDRPTTQTALISAEEKKPSAE